MRRSILALALVLAAGSVFAHGDDHEISRVNGGITAEAGQRYGDLDTVNGGIRVRTGATAGDVETVNGGISLETDTHVESVEAVNGGITAGERVQVAQGAETVNGGVRFGFNSRIGGDVATVNGGITLKQTEVVGQVHTVNGDITVGARSRIHGGILVEKPHGFGFGIGLGKNRIPRIVIGPNAVVDGELHFEREVELFVHSSARVGPISGATARPWTHTLPARP